MSSQFPKAKMEEMGFLALLLLLTAGFVGILLPFYGAILWAAILGVLFAPFQHRLEIRLRGRRSLAAGLSVLACICIVVIPGAFLLTALVREAAGLYGRLNTRQIDIGGLVDRAYGLAPAPLRELIAMLGPTDMEELKGRLSDFVLQASQGIGTQALTIGQDTAFMVVSLGVMLYMLFFFFRDGERIVAAITRASPLSHRHTTRFMQRFVAVARATVMGNIAIAAVQGLIGGTTFWLLGIESATFWGVVMGVLSLLPAVGAAIVWVPAVAILFVSGDYARAAVLLAVGVLLISTIDNFLRPPLVGKGTRLPDYVVLVSTLGGIALIGMNGFVLGPLVAALFFSGWTLFAEMKEEAG